MDINDYENGYEAGKKAADAPKLREALELCLTGGNHIASELVGALGGDFSSKFPPGSDHGAVREAVGYGNAYEMWCCWDALMRARAMIEHGSIAHEEATRPLSDEIEKLRDLIKRRLACDGSDGRMHASELVATTREMRIIARPHLASAWETES